MYWRRNSRRFEYFTSFKTYFPFFYVQELWNPIVRIFFSQQQKTFHWETENSVDSTVCRLRFAICNLPRRLEIKKGGKWISISTHRRSRVESFWNFVRPGCLSSGLGLEELDKFRFRSAFLASSLVSQLSVKPGKLELLANVNSTFPPELIKLTDKVEKFAVDFRTCVLRYCNTSA